MRAALGLLLLSATACSFVNGAALEQTRKCSDAKTDPNEAIPACSARISSGTSDDRDLGILYFNRSAAYVRTKAYDLALADLTESLRLIPQNAQIYGALGTVHSLKGELDVAVANFDRAIELDPDFAVAYQNRGGARQQKGEYAGAIPDFDRALELDPQNATALNGRCWSRAVLGQALEIALADCTASLEAGGEERANTLNSRGFVHFRRGEFKEAIADYDASIALAPNMASSFYIRALAKQALGMDGVDADMQKAVAIEPRVGERFAGYGITRQE